MNKISTKVLNDLQSPLRKNVEQAFNIIYSEYSFLVYYISLRIVRNKDIAQDITNETFLKFFQNRLNINKRKNVKYYIVSVAKNLSINFINSESHLCSLEMEVETYDKKDSFQEYLDKFSDFLNKEELDLIVFHLLYDYSFKEISKIKNTTTSSISSKYRRAIVKIKKHCKKEDFK